MLFRSNKDQRTAADITRATAYLKRSAYQTALWVWARTAVDGESGTVVADEADVTTGRVSQIRAGIRMMLDAGIPMPTTVDASHVAEGTYLAVSRAYKSGKTARAALKDAVKRAAAVDDVDAKHETLTAVAPIDDVDKRAPRPNDGTATTDSTDTNNNGAPAVGGATPTERPSTVTERLAALVADVTNGAPIADLDAAMTLVDTLADAVAARAGLTVEA